jgi:hypothetical protein
MAIMRSRSRSFKPWRLHQHLGIRRDDRHDVVEVVCNAGSQLPDRSQALLAMKLLLNGAPLP